MQAKKMDSQRHPLEIVNYGLSTLAELRFQPAEVCACSGHLHNVCVRRRLHSCCILMGPLTTCSASASRQPACLQCTCIQMSASDAPVLPDGAVLDEFFNMPDQILTPFSPPDLVALQEATNEQCITAFQAAKGLALKFNGIAIGPKDWMTLELVKQLQLALSDVGFTFLAMPWTIRDLFPLVWQPFATFVHSTLGGFAPDAQPSVVVRALQQLDPQQLHSNQQACANARRHLAEVVHVLTGLLSCPGNLAAANVAVLATLEATLHDCGSRSAEAAQHHLHDFSRVQELRAGSIAPLGGLLQYERHRVWDDFLRGASPAHHHVDACLAAFENICSICCDEVRHGV